LSAEPHSSKAVRAAALLRYSRKPGVDGAPGRRSYTLLRYVRDDNGSIHFATVKRMTPNEVDGSFDAALPFSIAEVLE